LITLYDKPTTVP